MTTMMRLPDDHPEIKAWEIYKSSERYANSIHWLTNPDHREGSMWAAFDEGWRANNTYATGLWVRLKSWWLVKFSHR